MLVMANNTVAGGKKKIGCFLPTLEGRWHMCVVENSSVTICIELINGDKCGLKFVTFWEIRKKVGRFLPGKLPLFSLQKQNLKFEQSARSKDPKFEDVQTHLICTRDQRLGAFENPKIKVKSQEVLVRPWSNKERREKKREHWKKWPNLDQ